MFTRIYVHICVCERGRVSVFVSKGDVNDVAFMVKGEKYVSFTICQLQET